MALRLIVSGNPEDFESELTILEFLNKKNIWVDMVTVEVNDKIIQKQDYQKVSLKENDRIETVFYMGGGMYHMVHTGGMYVRKERYFYMRHFNEVKNG